MGFSLQCVSSECFFSSSLCMAVLITRELKVPYPYSRALNEECRVSFTTCSERIMYDTNILRSQRTWRKKQCILHLEHVEKVTGYILLHSYPSRRDLSAECPISFSTCLERRMPLIFSHKRPVCRMPRILFLSLFLLLLCRTVYCI